MIRKFILLLFLIISFQGCATWMGLKKDSKEAWEVTKDTSENAYKSVKKTINEATSE